MLAHLVKRFADAHAFNETNLNPELNGRDMRKAFDTLYMDGTVVIGEGERDEAPMLYIGEKVGSAQGKGPKVDIALDPLEGTTICAKDMPNALAVIAIS